MEREEIFGAIIVLVIIIVIALIIYSSHGTIMGDIRNIADEVFGWTKAEQKELAQQAEEEEGKKFMERLIQIYTHSLSNSQADCTYDTRGYNLPETYKIGISYYPDLKQNTIVKFNLIKLKDETLDYSKTIERNDINKWKLNPCMIMTKEPKKIEAAGTNIEVTYTTKEGFKAGNLKLYDRVPKLYKENQEQLCFITPRGDTNEYKKPFLDLKDCETSEVKGLEFGKDFFNGFIASVEACKKLVKNADCKCDQIDFTKMPRGNIIKGMQDGDNLKFELQYNNEKIMEIQVESAKAVNIDTKFLFFQKGLVYEKWVGEQKFTDETKNLFISLTKDNEIGFTAVSAAKPNFFRSFFSSPLPSCSATYDTTDEACKRNLDPELMIKKLVTNNYDQIIMQATNDDRERLLLAGIISTESSGDTNAVRGDSAGLTQFTAKTARGYSVPCKTGTCYLCDPKGCDKMDNRKNAEISIPAGLKLLKENMAFIDKCAGTTSAREVFALAAYNVGHEVICNAIKSTGKQDPTWEEVKEELTPNVLRLSKTYQTAGWTKTELEKKIQTTKCYTYYVGEYAKAFTGRLFGSQQTTPQEPKKVMQFGTICVDAGHGGSQPGTVYNGLKEADANLETAEFLASKITDKYPNENVILTREGDVWIDYNKRTSRSECELFFTIHYNSKGSGALVYYPSETYREQNIELAKQFAAKLQLKAVPSKSSNFKRLYIDDVKEPNKALLWEVDGIDKYKDDPNYLGTKATPVVDFLGSYVKEA